MEPRRHPGDRRYRLYRPSDFPARTGASFTASKPQQVAFNEALVIVSTKVKDITQVGRDHAATYFDDSQQDRTFTYVELQSTNPHNVSLANNWQIQVYGGPAPQQVISTLVLGGPNATDFISAGQSYVIGSRTYVSGGAGEDTSVGSGNAQPSYFKVIPTWDFSQTNHSPQQLVYLISDDGGPAYSGNSLNASGNLDLDLVAQSGNNRFWLTDMNGNRTSAAKGSLLFDLTTALPASLGDVIKNSRPRRSLTP